MSTTSSNQFKSSTVRGILSNVDDTVNNITASANIQRDLTIGGDVILLKSNTLLSGDTNNFTIKNKYPIYTDIISVNPLIIDSNLLHFYTFNNSDLSGNLLKNQVNNQYDLTIDAGVIIDGTLNIQGDILGDIPASKIKTSITFNDSFTIGGWFNARTNNNYTRLFYFANTNSDSNSIQIY